MLDAWAARDDSDGPMYTTCGTSCPRQNGKNGIIEAYEFYKMLVCGEKILHTAHQVKTSNKSFQRLAALFTNTAHPEVESMVVNVRRTNGEQGIYLSNGAFVEYSARSRGASRGNTYSIVVYDEAQELTDEQVEALMSTIAASPTGYRQLIYTGTPPGPNSPGTVFPRIRKAAIARPSRRTCWHEWSIDECPPKDASFSDVLDDCYATNPALGIRLDEEFTEEEFNTMSRDGFARERLGWWSEQRATCAIPRSMWSACSVAGDDRPTSGKRSFAVKFAPDGSQVALCGCRMPEGGRPHVELVGSSPMDEGLGWLTDFLCDERRAETVAAVVVDGRQGADALIDRLREVYPRQALVVPGSKGVVAAATMFHEALRDHAVTHWDDPGGGQAMLDESALSSVKRPVGNDGAWAYGGESSAPVEAASLALWGAKTTRRDPEGGCVIL